MDEAGLSAKVIEELEVDTEIFVTPIVNVGISFPATSCSAYVSLPDVGSV